MSAKQGILKELQVQRNRCSYSRWQMLLPSGRCYSHKRVVCLDFFFVCFEADGIAMGLL